MAKGIGEMDPEERKRILDSLPTYEPDPPTAGMIARSKPSKGGTCPKCSEPENACRC